MNKIETCNCPKCGTGIKVTVNPQAKSCVGYCSTCKRLVNLGKAIEGQAGKSGSGAAGEKTGAKEKSKEAPRGGSKSKAAPSSRPNRRPAPSGSVKPDSDSEPKPGGAKRGFLRDFFDLD